MSHGPERTQEPNELHRPETAGELMQFLRATNSIWTSLPERTVLETPLRGLFEEGLCNTRHAKRVAVRRVIAISEWTDEICGPVGCCAAIPLHHPEPRFSVMMFSDARYNCLKSCIT